ncbi:MAG: hypothetical protein ACTHNN_18285 [Xanthobacteraceae bacterium]
MTLALPVDKLGIDAKFPGFCENIHVLPARRGIASPQISELPEQDNDEATDLERSGSNGTKAFPRV